MKNYAITLVWLTTACLFAFVVLTQLELSMPMLLSLLFAGQVLVGYTVYKVLTDKFKTNKSFKEWYEDMPKKELDRI